MNDCVFCKLAKGDVPRKVEAETDHLIVFPDINPKASIHLLIVPKEHIQDIYSISDELWKEIKEVACELGKRFKTSGFRLVNNWGAASEIKHMHVHFLGEVGLDREL